MTQISVRAVSSKADEDAFLKMPYRIYEDDPVWVAPPWQDHKHFFDAHHNSELQHVTMQKFVAWEGDSPVGTIIAHVHHSYNDYHKELTGWFGQFEMIDRVEVAHALLDAAKEWLVEQGMTKMMGPATYSTNSEIGLLIDGYEHGQMFMTTYAKSYYQDFAESYPGLEKSMDIWSWAYDLRIHEFDERGRRLAARTRKRRNFNLYHPKLKDWDKETERIREIYHNAWTENWGFIPLTEGMYRDFAKEMKQVVDPNIVVMVEDENGNPIAFGAPIPNIFQAIKAANLKPGEPYVWQMLKLLWQWKVKRVVKSARIFLMGVMPEYRISGVDVMMLEAMYDACKAGGYDLIELSWVLETNDLMNGAIEAFNAQKYKIHRIYEMPLG